MKRSDFIGKTVQELAFLPEELRMQFRQDQLRDLLSQDDPAATEFLQHNATILEAALGDGFATVQAQVRNFDFEQALEHLPEGQGGVQSPGPDSCQAL